MLFDVTDRAAEAWAHFDALLDRRVARISELSGVAPEHFIKINPIDFAEKNKYQEIRGHEYKNIRDFIVAQKNRCTNVFDFPGGFRCGNCRAMLL